MIKQAVLDVINKVRDYESKSIPLEEDIRPMADWISLLHNKVLNAYQANTDGDIKLALGYIVQIAGISIDILEIYDIEEKK